MKLNPVMIFLFICMTALVGMVLGGAFGWAAGHLAPTMFKTLVPWETYEPVGTATVLGAAVGVVLGGALGGFAVVLQMVAARLGGAKQPRG